MYSDTHPLFDLFSTHIVREKDSSQNFTVALKVNILWTIFMP